MIAYNALTTPVSTPVRIPVTTCDQVFSVTSDTGDTVATQLVPIPDTVLKIPGRESSASCDLVFIADNVPPLSFSTFDVEKTKQKLRRPKVQRIKTVTSLENDKVKVLFSESGSVHKVLSKSADIHMKQDFAFYRGAVGNNSR